MEAIKRTIGEKLKARRAHLGLSLDESHVATKIQKNLLKSIEGDRFSELPSAVVVRGFLKIYSEYLGIPAEPLIEEFNELHGSDSVGKPVITQSFSSSVSIFGSGSHFKYAIYLLVLVILSFSVYFALSGYSQERTESKVSTITAE